MRIPRIYCQHPLSANSIITLDEKASHHLLKVLRMQNGRELIVFNGEGGEYSATITGQDKKGAQIQTGDVNSINKESPLATHLAIGISKGDRFDHVLQKATELGVTEITPLFTERTEIKLHGDRLDKKVASWQQILISACEQCQRNTLPIINAPVKINEFLTSESLHAQAGQLKLVLHHRTEKKLNQYDAPTTICCLVGPEGGLSDDEIHLAEQQGFNALALGPRVLRTETAPLVALTSVQLLWGDL